MCNFSSKYIYRHLMAIVQFIHL